MTVTFTLSSLYTGATYVAGPFDIYAVTNTGASTQVGTGITKAQLATGHTISGISDATTGGTINSTGTCTNTYPWYVNTPEPTPQPTATGGPSGMCWTLTYDNTLPSDLYVRYRNNETGEIETTLINSLQAMDNQNGTYTTAICVTSGGSYSTPVFVQGGVEVSGGSFLWSKGSECTSAAVCLLN